MRSFFHKISHKLFRSFVDRDRVEIFSDDRFIVGYPKSGNTWLGFMLSGLLASDARKADFGMEKNVIDIYSNSEEKIQSMDRPRLLRSHEPYDPRYPKTLYIVRDPRSVCVSYFFHLKKFNSIDDSMDISTFVDHFVNGMIVPWKWDIHVEGWLGARFKDSSRVHIVHYEDLRTRTYENMVDIVKFLSIDADDALIHECIEWSSLENMKRIEVERGHHTLANSKKDIPFVREGKLDGWKKWLTKDDAEKISYFFKDIMNELGYFEDGKQ